MGNSPLVKNHCTRGSRRSAGAGVIKPVTVGLIWMIGLESTVGALIADGTPPLIDRSMVEAVVEVQTVEFRLLVGLKT